MSIYIPHNTFKPYEREGTTLKFPFFQNKPARALRIVLEVLKYNTVKKKDILKGSGYTEHEAKRPTQCAGAFQVLKENDILLYNKSKRQYYLGTNLERYIIYVILFMKHNKFDTKHPKIYQELTSKVPKQIVNLFNDLNL